jgi:alanine dehydrogenase
MKADTLLFLTSRDVQTFLTLDECITAVAGAFSLHCQRKAIPPAVLSMHTDGGGFHIKAGLLELKRPYFAAKINGNFPGNSAAFGVPTIQGILVLCDAANGTPLALIDSREITSLRTAAATAVAAKYLARKDSRVATVCGCGIQGRVQLKALCLVCGIEKVFAYDRSSEQALRFANDAAACLKIPVHMVTDLSSATRQSDICITCTPSQSPLLFSDDVSNGTFIAAVGADSPSKQELDPDLLAKSKVVCDIIEQCAEMGELHHALKSGAITKAAVYAELGEIVAGTKLGRTSDTEIVVFDSTGMALQDVAAAARVYERAKQHGGGVRLVLAA